MTRGTVFAAVLVLVAVGLIAWLLGSGAAVPQPPVSPASSGTASPQQGEATPSVAVAPPNTENVRTEPAPGSAAKAPPATATTGRLMLVGRLLREDGQPVSDAICACWIQRGSEHRFVATTCDGAGWFRLGAPLDFDGEDRRLIVSTRSRERVAAPWALGETRLANSYPPGVTDLGIVPMAEQGFLFAGKVREADGAVVRGASVFAMPVDLDVLEMSNLRLPERFRCETDKDGGFAIFGPAAHPQYQLVCRHPGLHQVEPVRTAPRATGLVLEMAAAGAVTGSVALAGTADWRQVFLQLSGPAVLGHVGSSGDEVLSTTRPLLAGQSLRLGCDAAGRFRADSLRPGLLDVAVHVWGRTTPVTTIAGVWIEAGKVCEEPRLQGIPLGSLRTVRLTFVTEAGKAVTRPMVVGIKDSDQSEWSRRVSEPDGTLGVSTATGSFDLLVQQAGVRRQLLADIRSDRTIPVETGLPVRVVVRLGGGCPAGYEVAVQLVGTEVDEHPEFEHPQVPRSESAVVTDGVEVELRVPAAGRYRAVAHLRRLGAPDDERMAVKAPSLAPLDIAPQGAAKPWVVPLEAAELQQAERVIRTLFGSRAATTTR